MTERDFTIYTPLSFFEKSDAPQGEQRRFAGLVSTESIDQEDEVVVQKGLDFSQFMKTGWFNDNHSKKQVDVLGIPIDVRFVTKGEKLPDGRICPADGHWAEGALIEGYGPADQVWNLGRSLMKTERRKLGFSIEGKILRRAGAAGKVIARANVNHVAITHCPVNTDTYMVTLAKSLRDAENDKSEPDEKEDAPRGKPEFLTRKDGDSDKKPAKPDDKEPKDKDDESEEKAFTVSGGPPGVGVAGRKPVGPVTGTGAGRVMATESLDREKKSNAGPMCKSSPREQLMAMKVAVERGVSFGSLETLDKFISVTREMKRAGVI